MYSTACTLIFNKHLRSRFSLGPLIAKFLWTKHGTVLCGGKHDCTADTCVELDPEDKFNCSKYTSSLFQEFGETHDNHHFISNITNLLGLQKKKH